MCFLFIKQIFQKYGMEIRDKIRQTLVNWESNKIKTNEAVDSILILFGFSPRVVLFQKWEEDPDDKTYFCYWGWEHENGDLFDEIGYELEEVLDKDEHGNITKALFKYVG